MARITNGILGGIKGKVGTVIGARWKGIDYIRHKGQKSTKPRSQLQLEQQSKFTIITKFVSRLSKVIMKTFLDESSKTSINVAFEYVYQNALTGTYPDYAIDFSKVLVSRGELLNANAPVAAPSGSGMIRYNWTDNTGALAGGADAAVVVVYCPATKQVIYTFEGAARSATPCV